MCCSKCSASGLPIVATAAGGSVEVVLDGKNGLLVPIDDLQHLAAAMRQLIGDADAAQVRAAAREFVEQHHGNERFVREYAALYRELLLAKRTL